MKAFNCFLAIGILMVLGLFSTGVGQNPPQPMYTSTLLTDALCYYDGTNCGVGTTNCSTEIIVLENPGTYYLHVWITCFPGDPTNCGGCYACAHLIRVSDRQDMYPGGLHTAPGNCDLTVTIGTALEAGVQYQLSVCKKPYGSTDCAGCDVECRANAQVHG